MKTAVISEFEKPLTIEHLSDPTPSDHGIVIRVEATGLCRSDWHGWMGHDPDVNLPHVPGHELAGQWVAVHGCGGVGLSDIMIANALEAYVVAVDIVE